MSQSKSKDLQPFDTRAAWDAHTLREDTSWMIRLTDSHRAELADALDQFKDQAHARGLTAQWLHGNMSPSRDSFPLPTLGPLLEQAQADLEEKFGLVLLRGVPVTGRSSKDLHLLHAGLASHIGTLRPQTVFGEFVQDLRDSGQAQFKERRGSKHNRSLPFHSDPCDVVGFLCIKPSQSGGMGIIASSVAIHNAMLQSAPEHVETLYRDFVHSYQEYLFVRTGGNRRTLPRTKYYRMPAFTSEQGSFACKYSRFYVDQAQEFAKVPRLSQRQRSALNAFEAEFFDEKWHLEVQYEPGDAVFINNFVCLHARTAFTDDALDEEHRRHLLRIWLSMPNSRPLSPKWSRHLFFKHVEAGSIRGGVPIAEPSYA